MDLAFSLLIVRQVLHCRVGFFVVYDDLVEHGVVGALFVQLLHDVFLVHFS